jgi:hypothetical protein
VGVVHLTWLALVVVLHVAVIVALLWRPIETVHQKRKVQQVALLEGTDLKFAAADGKGLGCDESYVGVGLKVRWDGTVIEVAPGGPAEKAGIVVGDVIHRPWYDEYEGGLYVVRVVRGNETVRYKMKRERICLVADGRAG